MTKGRFYFSLFRLIAMWRGEDPIRSESNGFEALLVGLLIYVVHYLFLASALLPSSMAPLMKAFLLLALGFGVWFFWLLLIYVDSLILRFFRALGLFRTIPTRHAQSVFWIIVTTGMAWALLKQNAVIREIGVIWLVAVALNLGSMLVLAFTDATRASGK
jgi:hypothetical protein